MLAAALFAAAGCGGGQAEGDPPTRAEQTGALVEVLRDVLPEPQAEGVPDTGPPGPRYRIARVIPGTSVALYDAPGGDRIAKLGDRTEFGSERHFWIAREKPGWYGVPVAELPNGTLGWIRADPGSLELYETRFWIRADVSRHELELLYGRKVLERFPVTVGGPGSPTPLGAYAVTDGLAGSGVGPYYGCCILALSGHQPNLPPDWLGGDRIAIHGTPGAVGGTGSAGCLRATDPDMVSLFARVPLGAPVFIRG